MEGNIWDVYKQSIEYKRMRAAEEAFRLTQEEDSFVQLELEIPEDSDES